MSRRRTVQVDLARIRPTGKPLSESEMRWVVRVAMIGAGCIQIAETETWMAGTFTTGRGRRRHELSVASRLTGHRLRLVVEAAPGQPGLKRSLVEDVAMRMAALIPKLVAALIDRREAA